MRGDPEGQQGATRVAYLTGRYPAVSHTFILREVRALRALGVIVDTFSIWRTDDDQLLARADREERDATYAILPLRPFDALRAVAGALVRKSPGAVASLVAGALGLGRPGLRGRALALSWSLEALILWDRMRRGDLRHVHVHINGTAPFVALLATNFGNRGGSDRRWSWSMTVHGPSEFYDVFGERLADKVQAAEFVVCISDFARSQLMALVDEEHWDKLRIVHCGVDLDDFPAIERQAGNGRPLQLLTVGRLVQVKGQAVLLQALADLDREGVPAEATIVGDGPKRETLERIAAELGVADRVRFTGSIGQDEILRYFEDADLFVTSTFAEGVPVVLMEAMATQLPVVSSQVMGIGELVSHEVNGLLVRPSRPDQLSAAIAELGRDPERRARLGREGRNTVGAEFDVHRSARQLRDLFAEFVTR